VNPRARQQIGADAFSARDLRRITEAPALNRNPAKALAVRRPQSRGSHVHDAAM
jgi:hypothetical protein